MPPPDDRRQSMWIRGDYLGLVAALIALVVFFGTQSEYFFSALTFTTLANQIPSLTVIAVGMTFVLIIAGIDLSVGSVMALSGAVLGFAIVDLNLPLWIAALLCLATGLSCGFQSMEFQLAAFFSIIIIYDAAGLRRAAGRQARVLNRLVDRMHREHRLWVRGERPLGELLGHTPFEVLVGIVFGIVFAWCWYAFVSTPRVL